MMRLLLPFLLLCVSCALAAPDAPEGHTDYLFSADPNEVQFFRAWRGDVDDCADCRLLERFEGAKRIAYFVEPSSTCSLNRSHVLEYWGDSFEGISAAAMRLTKTGIEEALRCANRETTEDFDVPTFLVAVGGRFVGFEYLEAFQIELGLFAVMDESAVGPVAGALRPISVPASEL